MTSMFWGARAFNQTLCWDLLSLVSPYRAFEVASGSAGEVYDRSCSGCPCALKPWARARVSFLWIILMVLGIVMLRTVAMAVNLPMRWFYRDQYKKPMVEVERWRCLLRLRKRSK